MGLTVLLQTSRVSAEATVDRLQAAEIDAQVIDRPNPFLKLSAGGNYRVRVAVPEEDLERARAELALWETEARPRVHRLAREVQLGLMLGSLPALAVGGVFLARPPETVLVWPTLLLVWFCGLAGWAWWSRRRARGTGSN